MKTVISSKEYQKLRNETGCFGEYSGNEKLFSCKSYIEEGERDCIICKGVVEGRTEVEMSLDEVLGLEGFINEE